MTLTFSLQPDDQIAAAGKRIGLMIMSSDKEFTLWPKAGTELHVDLDQSSIVLPVAGGEAALKKSNQSLGSFSLTSLSSNRLSS